MHLLRLGVGKCDQSTAALGLNRQPNHRRGLARAASMRLLLLGRLGFELLDKFVSVQFSLGLVLRCLSFAFSVITASFHFFVCKLLYAQSTWYSRIVHLACAAVSRGSQSGCDSDGSQQRSTYDACLRCILRSICTPGRDCHGTVRCRYCCFGPVSFSFLLSPGFVLVVKQCNVSFTLSRSKGDGYFVSSFFSVQLQSLADVYCMLAFPCCILCV